MSAVTTTNGTVRVVSEPLTYERERQAVEGISYFRDRMFMREDAAARVRLERHANEMDYEQRVNPNLVQGQGGYFAPPRWLIDQFAKAPRAHRSLAKLIDKAGCCFPLPAGVSSMNVPRITTGNSENNQLSGGASSETDVVDAGLTSPVVTITGQADVALQLLEQSPAGAHLDTMFFQDLQSAYDQQLETQLLVGAGPTTQPTPQFYGLLNLPNALTITYTSGSPSATAIFGSLGGIISRVGNNRKAPPDAWLMTTSRAAWLGSGEDQQQRPLMIADNAVDVGSFDLLAFPVEMNDAMPVTLSGNPGSFSFTGGNQDAIVVVRSSDMLLFESQPTMMVGTEVLSGTLQARLQYRAYAAFIVRYPFGVCVLGGTGLAVQTGFNT